MLADLYSQHVRIQSARTDEALAASGFDSLAIYAGRAPFYFLDDRPYPFTANPHFKAWLPLGEASDCWLVHRPGRRPRLLFMQPRDYWHKPPCTPQAFWTEHFDIETIREPGEARAYLVNLPRCTFIGEWREELSDWGFAAVNPEPLLNRLHYRRAIKTAYELECMRRASAIAVRGHNAALEAFRAGASEYEIHMSYVRATELTESELPYDSIVALNENAAVLHYQYKERQAPAERRSFLIDAGAQYHGYAADITRTYSAADDDEFAALIARMEQAQQELCAGVKAGVDYATLHLSAHVKIGNILRDAGIIKVSGEEALNTGLSAVFFPHGLGHLLGIQVHDVGGFSVSPEGQRKSSPEGHPYLRLTRTLEPGFVVTIEPGLYFIETLLEDARARDYARHIDWKRVEQFRPYGGIRIEDDVVCTTGEPENLTRACAW
ncbi:MAG TPA: Xaa-Pro dipeptidase [Steroidobacter sp.]